MPDGKLVGLYRVVFSDFSSLHLSKGSYSVFFSRISRGMARCFSLFFIFLRNTPKRPVIKLKLKDIKCTPSWYCCQILQEGQILILHSKQCEGTYLMPLACIHINDGLCVTDISPLFHPCGNVFFLSSGQKWSNVVDI
jgi:hypothetical protein